MKTPLWYSLAILSALLLAGTVVMDGADAATVQPVLVRADDPATARERTYFIGTGASVEEAVALRESLVAAGARNVNLMVPAMVIVCDLPAGALSTLDLPAAFRGEPSRRVESSAASGAESWGWIVDAYRTVDPMRSEAQRGLARPAAIGPEFKDVVLTVPPDMVDEIQREVEKSRRLQGAPRPEPARNTQQNSEFLGGSILANFIFPESNGSKGSETEDWLDADLTAAKQGALEAMLAYQGQWPKMDMRFTLNFGTSDAFVRAVCGYEPILHDMATDEIWIMDTMHELGYGLHTNSALAALHDFNEVQRLTFHTQWVFTAFIANSRTTPFHRFGGGNANYTAYAYLGGPFLVEPFPAGTDPNNVGERLVYSQIVNHEAGHNFWTLDEYPGSPGDCIDTSGYLNYQNKNQSVTDPFGGLTRCTEPYDCIMHSAARMDINPRPWCPWSEGHLGVIDNNGNGKPDIFEAAPEIVFQPEGPETVTTNDYTLRFKVISQAVPSQNRFQAPESRLNYAAPLDGAWITVGQHSRIPIEPLDGHWDELEEDCQFHVQVPQVGQFVFGVVAENSVKFASAEAVKVIYFTGVNYSRTALTVRSSRIDVSWEIALDPFGAKFNVYRMEPGEEFVVVPGEPLPGTKINQSFVPPQGPVSGGFVPYRFIDADVVPGRDYRYYVEGTFTLLFEGGERPYSSLSEVIAQTAMIPMVEGEVISNIAPNPSRGSVTFSVTVPRTYGGPARAPVREATPVEIAIYNVRGQLVRSLKSGSEFADVVTLRWDGTDLKNVPAPSGVYFVRAVAGSTEGFQKIVLIR
jgi:hypothetical protein